MSAGRKVETVSVRLTAKEYRALVRARTRDERLSETVRRLLLAALRPERDR